MALSDIKKLLIHKQISLADAIRMLRDEAGNRLTEIRMRWLDYELNGYPQIDGLVSQAPYDAPDYRKISGQYFAKTPSGIWADVSDTAIGDLAGFCGICIGVLEDVVKNPKNEMVDLQLGEILKGTPVAMRVHRVQLVKIDEAVRNTLIKLLDELDCE